MDKQHCTNSSCPNKKPPDYSQHHWLQGRVYDSLFRDIDDTTRSTIQGTFSHSIAITMPNVQKQNGPKDCGLFAVAFATILATEGNFEV